MARRLYMLPFDHRDSFATKLFGWSGTLSSKQAAEISAAKHVIYDGFQAAVAGGAPREHAAILADERFSADILRDACREGYMTACPAERSGQAEFVFEFGEDFARHIEAVNPTFCKVLVRYNPEGDAALNRRQAIRLRRLSDYLHSSGRLFMFELLVPPDPSQLERVGTRRLYDQEVRPALMVQAVHELQAAGVEPDVWKVEGMDRREDCVNLVAAARRDGRGKVVCIILGRGGRAQGAHMAHDRRERLRVHWLRRGAHDVLGCAGRVAGTSNHPRGRRCSDRRSLSAVGGHL